MKDTAADEKRGIIMESERALESLTLSISEGFTKFNIELKGFDEILSFFQTEKDFWQGCKSHNDPINIYNQHYSEVLPKLNQFKKSVEKHIKNNTFENQWQQVLPLATRTNFQNKVILFSSTPHAKYLSQLANAYPQQVPPFFAFITGKPNVNTNEKENFVGFIKGYEFLYEKEAGIVARREKEIESFQFIRNEWEQKTQDLGQNFTDQKNSLEDWKTEFIQNNEELKRDLEGWKGEFISENNSIQKQQEEGYTSLIDAAKQSISDLEVLYRNKLSLEAPVQYWKNRIAKYRTQGIIWASLLSLVVIGILALLLTVLYEMPEAFHHKLFAGEPEAIKGVIIFATIISFGAYLAKTFSRLTFSSFHLQRDSEEREQLTLVFLALVKDAVVNEEERGLVLQSLFSRAETGLLGGEGSPTMPGVGNIVDKFCGK